MLLVVVVCVQQDFTKREQSPFALPPPSHWPSLECGVNKTVGSGVWPADGSRRLMPEPGGPWDCEDPWPASLLSNSAEATRGQHAALPQASGRRLSHPPLSDLRQFQELQGAMTVPVFSGS